MRCGKRCGTCPHGPYWYSYERENGRQRRRYCGRDDPRTQDQRAAAFHVHTQEASPWWEPIFNRRTASSTLALKILEIPAMPSARELLAQYRRQVMKHHPDKGGSNERCAATVAAYTFLKSRQ